MATSRKKRAPLNQKLVLEKALALADEIGIEALSMRRLGEELGVEAMSLYKHAANKDEILDGIVDLVAAEIALPKIGGDWRAELKKRAVSAHDVLLKHPWATMLIVSRPNVGPAMLRYIDATIGCLREAGFSWAMADHAWNAIDNHVYGFTLQELNFPFEASDYAAAAKSFLPLISEDEFPYFYGLAVEVIEGRHNGLHDFELGLDLLLDGLERLRTRAKNTKRRRS